MSEGAPVATEQVETPTAVAPTAVPLREHSNENLLKVDTNDRFSNVSVIKKYIIKSLGSLIDPAAQPLFKGLKRINKNPRTQFLFMAFETEQDRSAALKLLQTISSRGSAWKEVPVSDRDLQLTHKGGNKRARENNSEDSKLTQYEKYTIEQQVELKKKHCLNVMKAIVPSRIYGWDAFSTRFRGVVESPVLEGYRNNANLSFGVAANGKPTIGFLTGSVVEGRVTVESAVEQDRDIVTMNVAAKVVAAAVLTVFREFEGAGLGVLDKVKGSGFWRRMQVRHNVKSEVMIDLELDEDSVAPELFRAVTERLVAVLDSEEQRLALQAATGRSTARVCSLQYHKQTGVRATTEEAERVILFGDSTLTETLCGLDFELSPTAFFQVNTAGMEKMLEKVQEVAELSASTTLLDLCSGTGTIGLTLARFVKRVVGIELVQSAVANAQRNAQRNHVENADFRCGRVEHLLPDVINGLSDADRGDIVAILDPPRAGVSSTVLKWIRSTPTIRRVVYISCEQRALERDCPGLTKPSTKAYRGVPFDVTGAFAVDLFPHTHHVEMVAVLTRRTGAEAAAESCSAVEAEKDDSHSDADGSAEDAAEDTLQ